MSQILLGAEDVLTTKLKSVLAIENLIRGKIYPGHTQPAAMPCIVYQIRDGNKVNPLATRSRLTHTLFWLFLCAKSYEQTRVMDAGLPAINLMNQAPGVMLGGLEVRRIRVTDEVSDEVLPSQVNEETPPRYRTRRVWISWMQPVTE